MVRPGAAPRPLPETVRLVVLDFDGVLTDDRVWVSTERARRAWPPIAATAWGIAR